MDFLSVNFYSFSALFNGFVSFLLACLLLIHQKIQNKVVPFLFFLVAVIEWSVFYFIWLVIRDPYLAEFCARTCMIGVIMMPPLFFHFTASLLELKDRGNLIALNYLIAFMIVPAVFTPLYLSGMKPIYGIPLWPIPGPLFLIGVIHFSAVFLYSHTLIIERAKTSEGIAKTQLTYTFIGTFIGGVAGASNFLSWYFPIPPYFNIFTSLFAFMIFYAITRYRLMDIDIIIRKGLLYTSITAIISAFYFSVIYFSDLLFKNLTPLNKIFFTIPAIIILALILQPLKDWLQDIIDRNFFKTKLESDVIANKFSDGIKKLFDLNLIAEYITRVAYKTFKLYGAAVFVLDKEENVFICLDSRGSLKGIKGTKLDHTSLLVQVLEKSDKTLTKDEIKYQVSQSKPDDSGIRKVILSGIIKEMDHLGFKLCVSSTSKKKGRELLGILALDGKRSEDHFSTADTGLLETLSNQVTISIENALLYQEELKAKEKAVELEKMAALGNATAGLAREVRKDLEYIDSFSKALPEKRNDRDFLLGSAGRLFADVEKIRLLMLGILDYSRAGSPRMDKLTLKQLVDDTLLLIRESAKNSGIYIEEIVDSGVVVEADKSSMKQALLNLLINAIEAMPSGGTLSVKTGIKDGRTELTISDTGKGISPDIMPRIFEPFFTTKEEGAGLGLAIVEKAVRENKATMTVASGPNIGTSFSLGFLSN